jgi:hypothetical protein
MTNPRYTGLLQGENISGPLGWIAFLAAVVLIAFLMFAGTNHGMKTASNNPVASTVITPNGVIKSPSTAGSDGTSQLPRNSPMR